MCWLVIGRLITYNSFIDYVLLFRIEHAEIRYGGQAFRLGRYAVHFHLSGSMNGSYVRHCAIHHSNNRAITAHGVHDLLIEGNVAYDIKGHTYFVVHTIIFTKFSYDIEKLLIAVHSLITIEGQADDCLIFNVSLRSNTFLLIIILTSSVDIIVIGFGIQSLLHYNYMHMRAWRTAMYIHYCSLSLLEL